ncbi:NrtR DNA-binding winged helix domain-containing protein [Bacteroides sp. 224]|uniref:NUDIX hydrolase n=1 Tax=Bacteroides sp. 224 TaxID=2302936 RepID=UPI0013D5EC58|nr:NUDIX domain-containing protein [Bacteroides sp. 224]NDV67037.1 NUDIX hydrolase [Bacteroides sp. 224]
MTLQNQYIYEYPRPAVTTDCVIFGFDEGELKVLLIERGIEPFLGKWALPGGFIDMNEDAEACSRRILHKETGLENIFMEQLYTFTSVERDPRYRVISITYYALVKRSDYNAIAGLDTTTVRWFALSEVPELAFDHKAILDTAKERLKGKIKYQPIGFELLPERFTMPELHRLYETILQEELDRRNFRKKMLSFDILVDTGEVQRGAQNRAPKLYCFDKQKYDELTQKGFYFEL